MPFSRNAIFESARFAGQVARYHTWPVHRQQSVGEHTWQVMRIWWQMFGALTPEESTYVLWHDGGELVTGDPPFPFKARHPEVKHAYDREEAIAVENMRGPARRLGGVSEQTALRCKLCDLLEMWEFGMTELRMGNEFAHTIVKDTYAAAVALSGRMSREDFDKFMTYANRTQGWYQA